jgi:hypothetical protein
MTILPSQTERESINLNAWEQAILWSANLLLAGKNQTNTRYDRTFTVSVDKSNQQININGLIRLNYEKYYASNLNLFKGAKNFEGDTNIREVTYDGLILPETIQKTIVEPSSDVYNLEGFYLYSVINFKDYLIANGRNETIVTYGENQRRTGIDTSITLDYKDLNYQISKDLLYSLNLDYLIPTSQQNLVTDDVLFTDSILLID